MKMEPSQRGLKVKERTQKWLSRVRLFVTPWTTESMEFSRPEHWSGQLFPPSGNLPNPGVEPGSPLPAEPPGKPKNTEMGSLFLLQQIFPTQESNQSLLHCRCILYQLNYQGIFPIQESNLGLLHCRQILYQLSYYSQHYVLMFLP